MKAPTETTPVSRCASSDKPVPSKLRNGLIAALDVGTTKIACAIARTSEAGVPRVVGFGHQASQGLRRGTIVDLDAAEASIRSTVEAAERMAGENIRDVTLNVAAGAPQSHLVAYEIALSGHEIGEADVRRILDPAAFADSVPPGHEMLHTIPVGYTVDGTRGVADPRGLFGQRLGVNLHLITGASGPTRNLATCIHRCHLDIAGRVVNGWASALGCLVQDEMSLGVTVVDIGGGTTSVAVFFDGELVHTDLIPLGGSQVTSDIARGLSTPLAQAERVKTLYGSCMPSPSDDRQLVDIPPIGGESAAEPGQVRRSVLVGIIRPRMEEIFEMVRVRLEGAGFEDFAGRRVVLTGGGSQLPGAADLAAMIMDKRVRLARAQAIPGSPDAASGPAFATVTGLLRYAVQHVGRAGDGTYQPTAEPVGRFARLGQWLRENF